MISMLSASPYSVLLKGTKLAQVSDLLRCILRLPELEYIELTKMSNFNLTTSVDLAICICHCQDAFLAIGTSPERPIAQHSEWTCWVGQCDGLTRVGLRVR